MDTFKHLILHIAVSQVTKQILELDGRLGALIPLALTPDYRVGSDPYREKVVLVPRIRRDP